MPFPSCKQFSRGERAKNLLEPKFFETHFHVKSTGNCVKKKNSRMVQNLFNESFVCIEMQKGGHTSVYSEVARVYLIQRKPVSTINNVN